MRTKKLHTLWALLLLPLLFAGCEKEEEAFVQQQQRIVTYLTSNHTPRLVAEADLEADSQLPFYTMPRNGLYRYIANYYNPDRVNRAEVGKASRVTITFRFYVFNFTNITDSTVPFYTNDPLYERAFYEQLGLTPGLWKFEPVTLDLSGDAILNGLRTALLGCRSGDELEVYMAYNEGYGSQPLSVVPKESPIAMFITIERVE